MYLFTFITLTNKNNNKNRISATRLSSARATDCRAAHDGRSCARRADCELVARRGASDAMRAAVWPAAGCAGIENSVVCFLCFHKFDILTIFFSSRLFINIYSACVVGTAWRRQRRCRFHDVDNDTHWVSKRRICCYGIFCLLSFNLISFFIYIY